MQDRLRQIGDLLYRRQDLIRAVQWTFVIIYALLLIGPLLAPASTSAIPFSAARFAKITEALFWGFWWPAVILSSMLLGQIWCGLMCPDGVMTEAVSRHGLHRKPAAWMRSNWLPLGLFVVLTLGAEAVDAHRGQIGNIAFVGGVSVVAVGFGLVYGNGKRIWCRYLCPVGSAFSLLARCSILHFKVDRAVWDSAPKPVPKPVDCPLLLDVRRLVSNEKCNMCARCSGHRGAVGLAARWPGAEIAALSPEEARLVDAVGIWFVLIGLGTAIRFAYLGWRSVAVATLLLGAVAAFGSLLAARGDLNKSVHLSYALLPMGGLLLLNGALAHSEELLSAAGIIPAAMISALRTGTLIIGVVWSFALACTMTRTETAIFRFHARITLGLTAVALAYLSTFPLTLV